MVWATRYAVVDKQQQHSVEETINDIEEIAIVTNQWKEERWQDENANDNNSLIIVEELAFTTNTTNLNNTCTTNESHSLSGSCHSAPASNDGVELVQINSAIDLNQDREIEENDNNRNTIQDDTGVASGSGTASSSSESHLHNEPEDDDSKDNYDMEDDEDMLIIAHEHMHHSYRIADHDDGNNEDTDDADETHVLVSRKDVNDLEDCDYYSDGDGIDDDEREEILKCNNGGDGIIANLFAGLYIIHVNELQHIELVITLLFFISIIHSLSFCKYHSWAYAFIIYSSSCLCFSQLFCTIFSILFFIHPSNLTNFSFFVRKLFNFNYTNTCH